MIQSHVSCRLNDNKLYDHNAEIDVKYALILPISVVSGSHLDTDSSSCIKDTR